MIARLVAGIALIARVTVLLGITNYILLFVCGFGVPVKSWWWVIGCGCVASVILRWFANKIEKENKEANK